MDSRDKILFSSRATAYLGLKNILDALADVHKALQMDGTYASAALQGLAALQHIQPALPSQQVAGPSGRNPVNTQLSLNTHRSYPTRPASTITWPLSMCHLDETICKTDKSALLKCLEKATTSN